MEDVDFVWLTWQVVQAVLGKAIFLILLKKELLGKFLILQVLLLTLLPLSFQALFLKDSSFSKGLFLTFLGFLDLLIHFLHYLLV